METLIMYAFIVASITFTICVTSVFSPVREYVSKLHPKLEELIHCPYCLGHYVALIVVLIANNALKITDYWIINIPITIFLIMGIVTVIHYIMLRAYEPVAKAMAYRKLHKNSDKDI